MHVAVERGAGSKTWDALCGAQTPCGQVRVGVDSSDRVSAKSSCAGRAGPETPPAPPPSPHSLVAGWRVALHHVVLEPFMQPLEVVVGEASAHLESGKWVGQKQGAIM